MSKKPPLFVEISFHDSRGLKLRPGGGPTRRRRARADSFRQNGRSTETTARHKILVDPLLLRGLWRLLPFWLRSRARFRALRSFGARLSFQILADHGARDVGAGLRWSPRCAGAARRRLGFDQTAANGGTNESQQESEPEPVVFHIGREGTEAARSAGCATCRL